MSSPADLRGLLSRRGLVGVSAYASGGGLRDRPDGVALCALDGEVVVDLHAADGDDVAVLRRALLRTDRVFVFDEARPALRRLLCADLDVARPVCRHTLERLLQVSAAADAAGADDATESGRVPRDAGAATEQARRAVHKLEALLQRVQAAELRLVARLECLVLRAFARLEHRGLRVDVEGWRALVAEAARDQKLAKDEVLALGGTHVARDLFGTAEINLDAEAEVKDLVRRVLGQAPADVGKHTLLALDHPLGGALVRYREASKIVQTYGESFLSHVDDKTGRVHATFVPLGASTGRVASRDPNLQNLPADARFHACLRAPAGRRLVTADYATCELRIVAELAMDPVFLDAFARGEDLHSTVATTMFGQPVSKTQNPELRHRAKAINFGLVYGMGAQALGGSLGVDVLTAQELLERYFKTFPRIRSYLEGSVERALKKGYAETILGRRLVFDPAVLRADNARGELSRIAKNMPIQGTSADMTKLAMVKVTERLASEFNDAGLVNTVHDELVVECAAADADAVAVAVREEMGAAHETLLKKVPPLVEVHVGEHWMH